MAFAIDNTTTATADTATFSHTTGTLTDGLLVVMVALRADTDNITGITYGGQALTRANNAVGNAIEADIWYKTNPLSGANNVVISGTLADNYQAVAASYSGVDQADPLNNIQDGTNTTANPSISVTPDENSTLVVGVLSSENGSAPTTGTEETGIANIDGGTWSSGFSYVIQGVAAAQAVNWTSTADSWCGAVASFNTSGAIIDAVSSIAAQSSTDPWIWSHTVAGTNRLLVVGVNSYNQHPTGVTYNSEALTQAQSATNGIAYSSIWYKVSPATGANNVSVDFASATWGRAGAISFNGADTADQPDASATENGTSATTNVLNLTTTTDNAYIVDCITLDTSLTNTPPTPASDQITVYSAAFTFIDGAISYKAVGNDAAQTMTETWTVAASTASYAHVGLSVTAILEAPADLSVAPSDSVTLSEAKNIVLVHNVSLGLDNVQGWKRGVRIWP